MMTIIFSKSDTGYKIETDAGQLIGQYTRNQIGISDSMFITISNVNMEIQI
jgi:hypothetical protein